MGVLAIAVIILSMSYISASFQNKCLKRGESLHYFTCSHDLCQLCVDSAGYPTHPGYCDKAKPCSSGNPGPKDTIPPVLTVNNPIDNKVYNSKKVLFDLSTNEYCSYLYLDNINGRGRWSNLGSNLKTYSKQLSLKDGLNDITIKAVDSAGNPTMIVRKFYVDSQKPKIGKIISDNNGNIQVDFNEQNPTALIVKYGNSKSGYNSYPIDLTNNCQANTPGSYHCQLSVPLQTFLQMLAPYNGQSIDKWVVLTDIAGNIAESKKESIVVDITPPVINNPNNLYTISGKYVIFNIGVTETNFASIQYQDTTVLRPRWVTLCNSLKNGYCKKKVSFGLGSHSIDIKAVDKSGLETVDPISFTI